jgi:hypothetical protein
MEPAPIPSAPDTENQLAEPDRVGGGHAFGLQRTHALP